MYKFFVRKLFGDNGNHIGRLNKFMRVLREVLSEEFTEDNTANTYWHIRTSLDDAFPDYKYVK